MDEPWEPMKIIVAILLFLVIAYLFKKIKES